jgi:hypothetical protein
MTIEEIKSKSVISARAINTIIEIHSKLPPPVDMCPCVLININDKKIKEVKNV